jgi:hypothetical protein
LMLCLEGVACDSNRGCSSSFFVTCHVCCA